MQVEMKVLKFYFSRMPSWSEFKMIHLKGKSKNYSQSTSWISFDAKIVVLLQPYSCTDARRSFKLSRLHWITAASLRHTTCQMKSSTKHDTNAGNAAFVGNGRSHNKTVVERQVRRCLNWYRIRFLAWFSQKKIFMFCYIHCSTAIVSCDANKDYYYLYFFVLMRFQNCIACASANKFSRAPISILSSCFVIFTFLIFL